jgi:hypothetical protein
MAIAAEQLIRHCRWPEGVRCTTCSSGSVIRHGHDETQRHRQHYRCKMLSTVRSYSSGDPEPVSPADLANDRAVIQVTISMLYHIPK